MNHTDETVKAGRLLLLDRGEYSDYQVVGFFVALQDFNPREYAERWHSKLSAEDSEYPDIDGLVAFFIRQGLLMEIEHGNIFLSLYSFSLTDLKVTP